MKQEIGFERICGMFKINEIVMYENSGIYRITDKCSKKFDGITEQPYYVMTSLYNTGNTVYIPVNNPKIKLRKPIGNTKAAELINSVSPDIDIWIDNDRQRQEVFLGKVKTGDHSELIDVIVTLRKKKDEKEKAGKRPHIADEKTLSGAEKLLYQELAAALDTTPDDIMQEFLRRLNIESTK